MKFFRVAYVCALFLSLFSFQRNLIAVTYTWDNTGSGNWDTAGNWDPVGIPNASGDNAILGDSITLDSTVTLLPADNAIDFLDFSSSNSYEVTGGTFTGGVLIRLAAANTADHTISSAIKSDTNPNLSSATTFWLETNSQGNLNVTGIISDSGSPAGLVFDGAGNGRIYVSGNNTYTQTSHFRGRVGVGHSSAFGTSTLSLSGDATLELDSGISMNNAINLNSVSRILSVSVSSGTGTLSGVLSNTGSLVKTGAGTLVLSGINTFSEGTTLSAGTLQLEDDDALGSGSASMSDGTTLALASAISASNNVALAGTSTVQVSSGTGTLSGVLSSTGALVKTGAGTLALSGTNTFSGGTTLSAGTLQLGDDGALGSGSASMSDGTTLALASAISASNNVALAGTSTVQVSSGTGTLSGVLSSTGALAKTGAGTLALSGTNTFSGGTTLSAGTLQLGDDGALGSGSASMSDGTTLALASAISASNNVALAGTSTVQVSSGTGTLSGVLSGTGALIKTGAGTLTLSGTNTFSGGTTLSAGTLQLGDDDALGSGSASMSDGTTLDLSSGVTTSNNVNLSGTVSANVSSGNSTLAGKLLGTGGNFLKKGSGNLILSGKSSYTGKTTVNKGTLTVNGEISSPLTVASGGVLKGTGKINNAVTCQGTLNPGNSIGTITVNGNYTQSPGSTYLVELNPKKSDKLIVTNNVFIKNNTTLKIEAEKGTYSPDKVYTLIESQSGKITGEFTKLVFSSAISSGEVSYTDKLVQLLFSVRTFEEIAQNYNAKQVGAVLDIINADDLAGWTDIIANLEGLTDAEIQVALNQMTPEQLKGQSIAQQNTFLALQRGLENRFNGLVEEMNCCMSEQGTHRVNLWGNFINAWQDQKTLTRNQNPYVGYDNNSWMGSAGADTNVFDWFYLGIFAGGSSTGTHWKDSQGNGEVTSGYIGGYSSFIWDRGSLNFSCSGGWNTYHADRNIKYTNVDLTAKNRHKGNQVLLHLDGGYNFKISRLIFRPFNSMDVLFQSEDSFLETGAGELNLSVDETSPKIFRNELGLKTMLCVQVESGYKFSGDLNLSWVREERFAGANFHSKFASVDDKFKTKGYYPDRNLFSPGLTFSIISKDCRKILTGFFKAELGSHYNNFLAGLEGKYSF